jgi:hypothetical protein
MRARLATLRQKLDRLRALDVDERVHGAGGSHGHHYRERACFDAAGIARLEAAHGVAFPDELRAFLESVHGGGPGPGYYFAVDPPLVPSAKAARPFAYGDVHAERLLGERRGSVALIGDAEDDEWPPGDGFIPVSHQGCGVYDVIVVTGEQRGRMWCCDMRWFLCRSERGQMGFLDWYQAWLDAALARLQG